MKKISEKIVPIIDNAIFEYFGVGYQLLSPPNRIYGPGYDTKWYATIRTPYGTEIELLSEDKMIDVLRAGKGKIYQNALKWHGNYFFGI